VSGRPPIGGTLPVSAPRCVPGPGAWITCVSTTPGAGASGPGDRVPTHLSRRISGRRASVQDDGRAPAGRLLGRKHAAPPGHLEKSSRRFIFFLFFFFFFFLAYIIVACQLYYYLTPELWPGLQRGISSAPHVLQGAARARWRRLNLVHLTSIPPPFFSFFFFFGGFW